MADTFDAPPKDQPDGELDFVRQWLEALELAETEEKDWRDTADRACDAYRGGTPKASTTDSNLNTFNLFHANVETLVPALYNSTPIPDVRRRFNDSDPVAKEVSELFERALSYQIDAYDFDQTMLSSVRDMGITSRGLIRVKYEPSFDTEGLVDYEQATCEYVPWRTFRRGPGKTWRDVPWVAFELYLSYSEVKKLLADENKAGDILKGMRFTYTAEPKKTPEQAGENLSNLAARARVWEIWDKDNRKIYFICPDYTERRLTTLDDPLGLKEFFPIPRPLSAIQAPDSLVPITLLQVYETLLEELNVVQRRILKLTEQMRARGWYAGLNDTDIQAAASAADGELTPLTGVEAMLANNGDISKAIAYWPLETIAKALEVLTQQREFIKQTIYEVTGLSDIVRGASDPDETATAQQLKSQWGSLRIQRMQAEVARFARDLFRMKAEIMARKFSFDTILQMASITYLTQEEKQLAQIQAQRAQEMQQPVDPKLAEQLEKPTREEVEKLFKQVGGFRIDIESDSTIRGDLVRRQEQQSLFLQGTAQYLQAVGPMVQEGVMPPDVAVEIYAGFARSFNLGKQAEDAIDRLADQVRKNSGQPKPPSPEEVKAQAEVQKMQLEAQLKREQAQMDLQAKQQEMAFKAQELELKKQEMELKIQFEQQKMQLEQQKMGLEAQRAEMEFGHAQRTMEMDAAMQQQNMNVQMQKGQIDVQTAREKAAIQRTSAENKERRADEKHKAERTAASKPKVTKVNRDKEGRMAELVTS